MEDRSGQVIAVAVVFFILTWITVGLRCYVRTFLVKGFGLDDKIMVLTLLVFTAYMSCQLGGAAYGTGQHRSAITDENAEIALRYWFFCEIFYTISTSILKISVGFFMLRITTSPIHVWIIRTIMIVSGIVGSGYTFLVLFQCKPISFWWNLSPDAAGYCLSTTLVTNFTYVVSALNSFADWTFGILPIFIVKDLQMKRRVKVVVASVIALAAIGSTATLIRLPYTSSLTGIKGDFLYRTTDFAIWTTVEVGVGITAGCIATLRPLFKAALGSSSGGNQSSGMPWSKASRSKLRDTFGQTLDELRPAAVKSVTTTTVTGGRVSSDSDEEIFLGTGMASDKKWKSGINKSVTTTVVEEHSASRLAGGGPSQTKSRERSCSSGQLSDSTLDDGESVKPTEVHERF
ncbi:integral membrane protein [Dothidotthia symphoricarpi CBS 119687]|uniref:Integral membrane protein n=1 Tax=Dothidotthia symphoricarpi CBS 119687 TaxID=1392245 RepID=A0A6A6A3K5_9PLEO|nr:uncharacterized protein P153DRAFT_434422 [Dothidotthia symphoricarpi CBS 119687]KAF2125338.1 integral membrane protein [Dothidotthia symphoricarpi CBS 119687]